jgi:hypothetical protein
MRCCQNKTSFSWSYLDSSKRSLENNVISRRGNRLEIGGYVQMAKNDPEAQRKSSLSDCSWLENEFGSFDLEALKFLMHFREPRSSLCFIFFYILIFFSFSHTLFFLSFSFSLFSFFFLIKNFYLLPLNTKITLYLPPPYA